MSDDIKLCDLPMIPTLVKGYIPDFVLQFVTTRHLKIVYNCLRENDAVRNNLEQLLKHLVTGGFAMAYTEEGKREISRLLKCVYPLIEQYLKELLAKEGAKQVAKEGAKQATKEGATKVANVFSHISKQSTTITNGTQQLTVAATKKTVVEQGVKSITKKSSIALKEGATEIFKNTTEEITKEASESVLTEGAKKIVDNGSEKVISNGLSTAQRAKKGAKAGAVAGIIIEGALCAYKVYSLSQKDLPPKEFKKRVTTEVVSSGGSVAGGMIGGAIGTIFFPGVGTFFGNVIGGLAGTFIGSEVGKVYGDVIFD